MFCGCYPQPLVTVSGEESAGKGECKCRTAGQRLLWVGKEAPPPTVSSEACLLVMKARASV